MIDERKVWVAIWTAILAWLIVCVALVAIGFSKAAKAQDTTPHHPGPGEPHWYPSMCCSGRDCEPLPEELITEKPEGWYIQNPLDVDKTTKLPKVIFVPKGQERSSMDLQYHWCRSEASEPNRYNGDAGGQRPFINPWLNPHDNRPCFFVPPKGF